MDINADDSAAIARRQTLHYLARTTRATLMARTSYRFLRVIRGSAFGDCGICSCKGQMPRQTRALHPRFAVREFGAKCGGTSACSPASGANSVMMKLPLSAFCGWRRAAPERLAQPLRPAGGENSVFGCFALGCARTNQRELGSCGQRHSAGDRNHYVRIRVRPHGIASRPIRECLYLPPGSKLRQNGSSCSTAAANQRSDEVDNACEDNNGAHGAAHAGGERSPGP